jgi:hypothetical protein
MKCAFLVVVAVFASTHAGAAESRSGTWQRGRAIKPTGELLTIDRAGEVEFQLSLWGGPPAHDWGVAQGHLVIRNEKAVFETSEFGGKCRLEFAFSSKDVVVKQIEGGSKCGFGHNIIADGRFVRVSRKVPDFRQR